MEAFNETTPLHEEPTQGKGGKKVVAKEEAKLLFSFPPPVPFSFLVAAFVAALLLTVLHLQALAFAWYWRWWWFDWVMHFLGGVTLALLITWGWLRFPWGPHRWWGWSFGVTIALGLGVAMVVWEVGEYVGGVATEAAWEPYPIDTMLDIALGSLGGWWTWRVVRPLFPPVS